MHIGICASIVGVYSIVCTAFVYVCGANFLIIFACYISASVIEQGKEIIVIWQGKVKRGSK